MSSPVGGGPAYQPAPVSQRVPKSWRRRRGPGRLFLLLGVVFAVVVVIAVVVVATKPGSGTKTHPAAADVSISGCSIGPTFNLPQATGTIVNHSSGTSDYSFTVSFLNQRGEVAAHGSGSKNHVAPQQTAAWTVMGDTPNDGPLTCRLEDVSRFASR
jgi:hypothetical protein